MAARGSEKETGGKLLNHIENAQKKYFICLSEIRTPIICFYVIITLLISRHIQILHLYVFKNVLNMFLYSITEVSVRRAFKECENMKLIQSLLQFKIYVLSTALATVV
jgi:hypothetical protein